MRCPKASDPRVNAKNRQKTIDRFGFGPADVANPPRGFWEDKSQRWKLPVKLARLRRCGNCGVYDISEKAIECGLASWDGELGYCRGHDFTCSALRVCNTWSPGGPVME